MILPASAFPMMSAPASAGGGLLLDTLTTAVAAYSFRRLRTNYLGSCIRVRRSSDNTEQDIEFSGNVINTTALLSFVGSGDGFISTWYDQSVSGFNISQATFANQPQIVSSGVIQTLNSLTTALGSGNQHLNYIASSFNRLFGACVIRYKNGTESTFTDYDAVNGAVSTPSNCGDLQGESGTNRFLTGAGAATETWVNGVSTLQCLPMGAGRVVTYSMPASTTSTFRLFGEAEGRFWTGAISENILFSTSLTTTERQLLENNQRAYYGI